jgi:8-oxo-dGTP diphosphatase
VTVEVVAAVIQRADGAFLLASRPAGKVYAGWWEFPGGKVEQGESLEAALRRELHEELGIDVRRAYPWIRRVHDYPHASVGLNFFRVLAWDGEPHPREAQDIRWQRLDEPLAEPMLPANAPVVAALALPHEYAITSAETRGTERMLAEIERRLRDGLRLLQVRDKGLARDMRARFAREAAALAHRHGARLLVNSDLALAREIGADGVHYGARELLALRERPAGLMAAASCHDRAELEAAMRLELDFAVLGPVKPTPSHPGVAPFGWRTFAELARGCTLPLYAIGGLRSADLDVAWRSGAHGVAMISGSWGQPSSS